MEKDVGFLTYDSVNETDSFHSNIYFLSKHFRIPPILFIHPNLYHVELLFLCFNFGKENQRSSALQTSHFSHLCSIALEY
jgi:hypothetical protein